MIKSKLTPKNIRLFILLIFIWLFAHARVVGIIINPDKELWMSSGQTTSQYERLRIKLILLRGANPTFKYLDNLSTIQFAVMRKDLWLIEKLITNLEQSEIKEILTFAKDNSEDQELIGKIEELAKKHDE